MSINKVTYEEAEEELDAMAKEMIRSGVFDAKRFGALALALACVKTCRKETEFYENLSFIKKGVENE